MPMRMGEKKNLNDFKFGTSIGRFASEDAASTAAKGLMISNLAFLLVVFQLTVWQAQQ